MFQYYFPIGSLATEQGLSTKGKVSLVDSSSHAGHSAVLLHAGYFLAGVSGPAFSSGTLSAAFALVFLADSFFGGSEDLKSSQTEI